MKALKIIVGIILLLPGLCSLGFMLVSLPNFGSQDAMLFALWIPCFAVSAFGIWLLYRAGQPK